MPLGRQQHVLLPPARPQNVICVTGTWSVSLRQVPRARLLLLPEATLLRCCTPSLLYSFTAATFLSNCIFSTFRSPPALSSYTYSVACVPDAVQCAL